MNVLFVRSGVSEKRKKYLPVRIQEPLELAYLASQIQDSLQERIEITFLDMELERGSFKKHLLRLQPSLVVFWGEKGQGEIVDEQASIVKETTSGSYVALAGELSEEEASAYVDFLLRKNLAEAINETLLGIITERSLEEIQRNVSNVERDIIEEALQDADRGIFKNYQDRYYFLQYGGTMEITSQLRFEFDESDLLGKQDNPLRDMKDIAKDIESFIGSSIYFKDRDIWDNPERLKSLLEIIKETAIQRTYISVGNWESILENESLLEEFSKLGLKTILMEMDFPKDQDDWIYKGEVLRLIRKYGVEPIIIIKEKMEQEDQKALIFWLKDQKQGLVILEGEAFLENRSIYKEICISVRTFIRWTKEHGLGETLRRQKEYKNTLLI